LSLLLTNFISVELRSLGIYWQKQSLKKFLKNLADGQSDGWTNRQTNAKPIVKLYDSLLRCTT